MEYFSPRKRCNKCLAKGFKSQRQFDLHVANCNSVPRGERGDRGKMQALEDHLARCRGEELHRGGGVKKSPGGGAGQSLDQELDHGGGVKKSPGDDAG
ncbi:uncharacterized protein A4U43_UnF6520 [Asparagus officinalis]|uniref:Uncharacterized protein n=1 Tax=Asparagus officinalis TaxID=4686 RepID=A0A1R3L6F7_ASPOF|nr:uncharacterized protein A4U43_UnF6520 [Asparagus officinalis]